jgi:predicted transcriptional regulator
VSRFSNKLSHQGRQLKTAILGIKSLDEGLKDFADTFKAIQLGDQVKPQPQCIYFTDFEAFRKAMTPQRFAILKMIREKHPDSISGLADMAGRNIKNVSEDVRALVNLGLVEISQAGRNKAPHLRFEKITVELSV